MKTIVVELPNELSRVEIVPLGDIHKGEEHIDNKALYSAREYILKEKNRYVVVNGDVINLALKFSKSDVYGEQLSPMQEIELIAEFLKPLKDRILVIIAGNHEGRLYKETGIDAGLLIASELGLKHKYSKESAVIILSFGYSDRNKKQRYEDRKIKLTYSIYCHHGFGGGRTNGSKLNKVVSLDNIVDADLYIMGHHHTPSSTKQDFFRVNYRTKDIEQVTRAYMIHGAWLKFGGYGEQFGYAPSSISLSRAILNGVGKKSIEVVI